MDITRFHERSQNITRTSLDTCIETFKKEASIEPQDGQPAGEEKVELHDVLVIETTDGQKYEFEIVGLVEDDEHNSFAVAYSEKADEFVVTGDTGKLLTDDALAQEILDDFFVLAEESAPEET